MRARLLSLLTALVALLLVTAAPAAGASCTWIGPADTDWADDTVNWDCGVIPDGDDDVFLDGGLSRVRIGENEAAKGIWLSNFASLLFTAERTLTVGDG